MIRTKIVGVTFKNSNGTDRQEIISQLRSGERLYLRDMSDARFPEAIGVFNRFGDQCGSIKKELAIELRGFGDFESFPVHVLQVTGGDERSIGCNIEIEEKRLSDELEDALKFLDEEESFDDDDFSVSSAPARRRQAARQQSQMPKPKRKAPRHRVSKHNKWCIFVLCVILGIFGVHRLYLKKKATGFIYLFTFGLFGVGWVFDLVMIATGNFKDEKGLPIV